MLRISEISFPGLGIGEFSVDSTAFTVFGIEIAWYAIIITLGIICAVFYVMFRAKQIGIKSETIIDFALWLVPMGVIGARLYYVLTSLSEFDSFLDVINIRNGGLAIYGGIIAGFITCVCVAKYKKIPFFAIADCISPSIIAAQAIGRWGNFTNGEAFGYETTHFIRMGLNNFLTGYETIYVHPTFLYESLWNVLGFILVNIFFKHRKYDGQILLMVFGWYGLGRMFIEGLRTDSLYIKLFGLSVRISQLLGALIFAVCAFMLIFLFIKKYNKPLYRQETNKTEE